MRIRAFSIPSSRIAKTCVPIGRRSPDPSTVLLRRIESKRLNLAALVINLRAKVAERKPALDILMRHLEHLCDVSDPSATPSIPNDEASVVMQHLMNSGVYSCVPFGDGGAPYDLTLAQALAGCSEKFAAGRQDERVMSRLKAIYAKSVAAEAACGDAMVLNAKKIGQRPPLDHLERVDGKLEEMLRRLKKINREFPQKVEL